jgi:hypothetical protein
LAQFLGHIQPINPEEEKRRKKQEKLAKKREADETKAKSPRQEQYQASGMQASVPDEIPVAETSAEVASGASVEISTVETVATSLPENTSLESQNDTQA